MIPTRLVQQRVQSLPLGSNNDGSFSPEVMEMTATAIEAILNSRSFAVAGASRDKTKYGNIIFDALLQKGYEVYPINPSATDIEGHPTFPDLQSLPSVPDAVSIVTPPSVTPSIIEQAIALGVKKLWIQPGAQEAKSSQRARDAGLLVVDDGSCILVALATR